ncbi:hypothetical protein [Acidaminobacterium chupaoyuni]
MKGVILEILANEMDCCLSDLRYCPDRKALFERIETLFDRPFSAQEWSYSLSYIFDEPIECASLDEVKELIHIKQ